MPKPDITKMNVAVDKLLETTENPRHRIVSSRNPWRQIARTYGGCGAPAGVATIW